MHCDAGVIPIIFMASIYQRYGYMRTCVKVCCFICNGQHLFSHFEMKAF